MNDENDLKIIPYCIAIMTTSVCVFSWALALAIAG